MKSALSLIIIALAFCPAGLALAQPATSDVIQQKTEPSFAQSSTTDSARRGRRPGEDGSTSDTRGRRRRGGRGSTTATAGLTSDSELTAPSPEAEPGKVLPTAVGHMGGATSFTQEMPLDVEGLIEMRKPFIGRPELRGAWVSRFDWVVSKDGTRRGEFDANASREKIISFMQSAKDLNLNAIFFQVRGDATTFYPSKLEPWSRMVGGKDPGFDPLRLAIDEAHKRGIELHAYVNPCPVTEEGGPPADKNHIWYKHCVDGMSPNWRVFADGKPAEASEYIWFNPNLPEVQTYIRTVMVDLVERYRDLDGIHFDRIRLPSDNVSDDPWSKERFAGPANPDKLEYNPWQASNISRMITDIYGAVNGVNPKIKVSAAVWGIYDKTRMPQSNDHAVGYSWTSSGLHNYMQDSVGWINAGSMDALVPMIYWNMGGQKPDYDELLLAFVSSIHNGRFVYGGQRVFSPEEMLREVVATNLIGAQGTVPFTLGRIARPDMSEFYKKNIYPEPAPVPAMPWKTNPKTGMLLITVRDAQGKPVTDAIVKLAGRKSVALSSADGFCAILNVEPGEAQLQADKTSVGTASAKAAVTAGKAVRQELTLK